MIVIVVWLSLLWSEASLLKCAGRESAGLPALSHTLPCMRKCRLPADPLLAHFIGEASVEVGDS